MTSTRADAAAPPATARGSELLTGATVALVVAGLALARQSGLGAWHTLWGEDGSVFLTDVWNHGWHSFVRPYAGYWEIVPRALALPAGALPPRGAAIYFALTSAAMLGVVAAAVWRISRTVLLHRGARFVLALTFALLPAMIGENLDNATNLIWALLFAMFWACASTSDDGVDTGIRVTILGLGAASTALAVLYLPGAAFLVWRRKRGDLAAVAGYGVGGLLQAVIAIGATQNPPDHRGTVADVSHSIATRIAGSAVFGERWLPSLTRDLGAWFPWLAVAVLLGALAVAYSASRPGARRFALVTLAFALLVALTELGFRGADALPTSQPLTLYGSRYAVVPLLLVVSAFVILLDGAWARPGWPRVVTAVFLVWALVLVGVNVRNANGRSAGADWRSGVAAAQAECRAHPHRAAVAVTTSPTFIRVTVPCSRLR